VSALDRRAEPEVAAVRRPVRRTVVRVRPRGDGDRYSRRVAFLKRMLPALGLTLLVLVAAWPRIGPLLESVQLGFPVIDLREARELRMLNPHYAGIDRFNRPYFVTAAIGRQVPNRDDLMSLEGPRAEMILRQGASVVVTAVTAIYQSQAQLLDLFDDVNLVHENGTHFATQNAHVDVSASTAEGHEPVVGHGPSGDITAQGFRILDKGDTIIFTGNSHLLLKGTKPTASPATPAELPAEVEAVAAQIAAGTAIPAAAPEPGDLTNWVARAPPSEPATKPRATARPHGVTKQDGKFPDGAAPAVVKTRPDAS
jgi:lipopolysaccharide export system protein LptC